MARDRLVELPWPIGGFVENTSQQDQAEDAPGTTTDALNVRTRDAADRRKRGGQRTGLELYLADAVNGSNFIQSIGSVVLAFEVTDVVPTSQPFTRDFTDSSVPLGDLDVVDPGVWELWKLQFGARAEGTASTLEVKAAAGLFGRSVQLNGGALDTTHALYAGPPITLGSQYIMNCRSEGDGSIFAPIIAVRVDTGSQNYVGVDVSVSGGLVANFISYTAGLRSAITIDSGSTSVTTNLVGVVTDPQDYSLEVSGNTFTLKVNGGVQWVGTSSAFSSNTDFAWGAALRTGPGIQAISSLNIQLAESPASLRTTKLVVVSGGTILSGNKLVGLSTPAGGSGVLITGDTVFQQPAFQKTYFADGQASGYRIYDPKLNTVVSWQDAMTAGALPAGGSGTKYTITAVDIVAGTFTVGEDLSAILSAGDFVVVQGGPTNNNRSYTVASTSGTGPTVVTVDQTIKEATVSGTLAKGDVGCKIVALFRGRLVLTALETEPHNIFMLAVADPLDINYFPTTTSATQAVAANITKTFGTIGDVVTAWATYTDDMAIIGMANSLAVLRGDPAAGGVVDNISDKIGIVGPEAWTFDTAGRFYFMATNGLYRMDLGTFQPILISQNKLDKTFTDINTASKRVQLLYDPKWQGVHILIKSQAQQTVTADKHYFYSEEDEAFWPDQYPLAHGPVSAYRLTADNPEENAVLFGGWDSKVRAFGDTANTDDGTLINSFCRFPPMTPGSIVASARIHDIVVMMDDQSDAVNFKIFTGGSVEAAEAAADAGTPRVTKTLTSGLNGSIRQRVAQNTIIVELSQNGVGGAGSSWAFEKAMARISVGGRMHGRGV
jgi:hypothetical protein